MKEYQVAISRTYTTYITLKFPDDDRKHMDIINEKIQEGNQDIWDLIAEKELEQMDISNDSWEISEINNTIINNASDTEDYIRNNTTTGALSNDTGPRN